MYGVSPLTTTFTVWSRSALVDVVPRRSTRSKASSAASSQTTRLAGPRPLPGTALGTGVTRVHSSTSVAVGSPLATPKPKTPDRATWPTAARAASGVRGSERQRRECSTAALEHTAAGDGRVEWHAADDGRPQ